MLGFGGFGKVLKVQGEDGLYYALKLINRRDVLADYIINEFVVPLRF